MKEIFQKELISSGYVHSPLPLHQEKSLEREREEKPVLARSVIWDGSQRLPEHSGRGAVAKRDGRGSSGGKTVLCYAADRQKRRTAIVRKKNRMIPLRDSFFPFEGENWEEYNRLYFRVKPECMGGHKYSFPCTYQKRRKVSHTGCIFSGRTASCQSG